MDTSMNLFGPDPSNSIRIYTLWLNGEQFRLSQDELDHLSDMISKHHSKNKR